MNDALPTRFTGLRSLRLGHAVGAGAGGGQVDHRHAVQAAGVVAKPDEKWGETPCAFVELKPGATATAEELIAYAKQHLAGFKVPRHIVFAELPKTSTGKIQKFELRAQFKVIPG